MEEIHEGHDHEEKMIYSDLMSKLSGTPTSNNRFKDVVMKELARRTKSSKKSSKERPPPPSVPPPQLSSPSTQTKTNETPYVPPPPPSSPSRNDHSSSPSRSDHPPSRRFQTTDHRKETRENMSEIKRLRSELYLSQQTSAFRGLRCIFEKLARRECEKRVKTLNRDQRVHELESMILKRDTKIENLEQELVQRSNSSDRRYHDTMQSIQIEASKTVENVKSAAIRAAKSSEQRHKIEMAELTRRKDAEIEMLRAQVLKFHTNMEEMSRNNSTRIRQSRATSAHELSLAKSELQSMRSNLEVSRAKCEMLERNVRGVFEP